jgi:hypothetical protein
MRGCSKGWLIALHAAAILVAHNMDKQGKQHLLDRPQLLCEFPGFISECGLLHCLS